MVQLCNVFKQLLVSTRPAGLPPMPVYSQGTPREGGCFLYPVPVGRQAGKGKRPLTATVRRLAGKPASSASHSHLNPPPLVLLSLHDTTQC